MHESSFITDLAIVMMGAGIATILFHRLKLPVLLGYILTGVLLGPHTPGPIVNNPRTIEDISNLGVVLLMFTLGLEFSLPKLREVGAGILVVAVAEVGLLVWLGYGLGGALGWSVTDSIFLGAIIALSSTMVATRNLAETGQRKAPFARLVVGMLVAEDILTVFMLAMLGALAIGGHLEAGTTLSIAMKLSLFIVTGLVLGLLLLPRLIDYLAETAGGEMLLIGSLAVCFGVSLFTAWLGFSVALGAFLSGMVVAQARQSIKVQHLVEPLRDMFTALFFISMGLKIDPASLPAHAGTALLVAAAVLVGKTLACGLGVMLAGHSARSAARAGLCMAQLGEFSLLIAAMGMSLRVVGPQLYPITVMVVVIGILLSSSLMKHADGVVDGLRRVTPQPLRVLVISYGGWLASLKPLEENAAIAAVFKRFLWHIGINVILVITLFVIGAYINMHGERWFDRMGIARDWQHSLIWACALFCALPLLIAIYRKAEALGMLLAELGIREHFAGAYTLRIRGVLARLIPLATLVVLALMVGALSSAILPPRFVLWTLLLVGVLLAAVLWPALVRLHAKLQAALRDTLDR